MESFDFELPAQAAWKDASFLSSLAQAALKEALLADGPSRLHAKRRTLETVVDYMQPESSVVASLREPRYQPGFLRKTANYLLSVVSLADATAIGGVMQEQVSPTLTLLKVESTDGWFFAKTPAPGCNEVSITETIASTFPESTLDIVGTSVELNCFVSRGFDHVPGKGITHRSMVRELGRIQIQSLENLDKLRDGGCLDRGPKDIAAKCEEWYDDACLWLMVGMGFKRSEVFSKVKDACLQLESYNIPCTLVHGDFHKGNVTLAPAGSSTEVILFDWQYACIGHPFCDFFLLMDSISEDVKEEYLGMWSAFESMEGRKRRLTWRASSGVALKCGRIWTLLHKVSTRSVRFWKSACMIRTATSTIIF